MSLRTDAVLVMASADEDAELWVDLISWLCDAEGSESFMSEEEERAPMFVLLRECSDEELRDLRLATEVCPVHHVDGAICRDDGVGDGAEHCGEETAQGPDESGR